MTRFSDPANVGFLFSELQTGLTFANLAISARSDQTHKKREDTAQARKAHDTFLKYRERVELSENETVKLDAELEKLRTALRSLGESV